MCYRAIILSIKINLDYPGYQRLFLACGELLRGPTHLRPKAEATNDEVARATIKTQPKPKTAHEKSLAPRVNLTPEILDVSPMAERSYDSVVIVCLHRGAQ